MAITKSTGPAWVTLSGSTLTITTPLLSVGTYPVVITLNDGLNLPVNVPFNVIVDNQPPVCGADPGTIEVGSS